MSNTFLDKLEEYKAGKLTDVGFEVWYLFQISEVARLTNEDANKYWTNSNGMGAFDSLRDSD